MGLSVPLSLNKPHNNTAPATPSKTSGVNELRYRNTQDMKDGKSCSRIIVCICIETKVAVNIIAWKTVMGDFVRCHNSCPMEKKGAALYAGACLFTIWQLLRTELQTIISNYRSILVWCSWLLKKHSSAFLPGVHINMKTSTRSLCCYLCLWKIKWIFLKKHHAGFLHIRLIRNKKKVITIFGVILHHNGKQTMT